jgi:hypothetical protein
MELGQVGGLNYRMSFPTSHQQTSNPSPIGLQNDQSSDEAEEFIDFKDPLAVRRKLTSDLFRGYQIVKNIAKDAREKGLDPFNPDISQEGGGLAYQAMEEAKAGLMYAANLLKLENDREKQLTPYLTNNQIMLNPDVDRNSDMWASQGRYTSTHPLPFVENSNKGAQENTYTIRDEQRNNAAYFERAAQNIDDMVAKGEITPFAAEIQKAALMKNVSQVYAPSYFDRNKESASGKALEAKSMMNLFQKVANHSRGVFPEGTYTTKVHLGHQYAVSHDFKDDNFGETQVPKTDKAGNETWVSVPKKIEATLKDKDGNVYFKYQDPSIPIENISAMAPDEVLRRLVESNSGKYGGANSLPIFYNELEKNGYLSQNRSVPVNTVFGEGSVEQAEKVKPNIPGWDRIEAVVKPQFDNLSDPDNVATIRVEGGDGSIYKFSYDHNDEDGVYLSNWKEAGYDKENRPKNLTYDKYLMLLDSYGAWNKYLEKNKAKLEKLGSKHFTAPVGTVPIEASVPFNPNWNAKPNTLERQPGESQAQYDLRIIRERRNNKK